jgi:hypothetical protein
MDRFGFSLRVQVDRATQNCDSQVKSDACRTHGCAGFSLYAPILLCDVLCVKQNASTRAMMSRACSAFREDIGLIALASFLLATGLQRWSVRAQERPDPARLQHRRIRSLLGEASRAIRSTPDIKISAGTTCPFGLVDPPASASSCWRSRNCRARGFRWPGCARAGRASGPGGRRRSAASGRTASSCAPRPAD